MSSRDREAKRIIAVKLAHQTVSELAAELGVHSAHISNVTRRGISPTLDKALVDVGWLAPPQTRIRIAADVTAVQRDRLHAIANQHGMTWSELCQALADNKLTLNGNQACGLSGVLPANGVVRIWALAEDEANGGINCGYDGPIWNNSESDPAALYDAGGNLVDRR